MNPLQLLHKTDKQVFNRLRRAYQKRLWFFPLKLEPVPDEEMQEIVADKADKNPPRKAWRSRFFLVQLFKDGQHYRLSVNRCGIDAEGGWKGDITWDELMECKRQCGYGDHWAIEVYPPDEHVVNVANIRHLFLLEQPPACAWLKNSNQL